MNIIGTLIGFFLGNFYLILGASSLAIILLLVYYLSRPRMEVLYFSESDRRLKPIKINKEKPRSLVHKGSEAMRFFKYRGSWGALAFGGLKKITTFLGKMGTAYTFQTEGGEVKIGKLYDAVKLVWGEDVCDKLKPEQRDLLQKSEIYVTVDLEKGITPEGFEPITEGDIASEGELKVVESYARGRSEAQKPPALQYMFTLIAGAGIGIIASIVLGWIRLAPA